MNVFLRTTTSAYYVTSTTTSHNIFARLGMPSFLRWFFVLAMLITGSAKAQLSGYTFSFGNTASLTDMSSGTTSMLTAATYHDDVASAVTNIGFSFNFNGTNYTQFSANSNGQMLFGGTAIAGGARTPSLGSALLAPMGGDNAIQVTGSLQYKLTGTSPNQVLTVEWNSLRIPFSSTAGTGSTIQVRLYEGSNVIQFVYGTVYNNATSATSRTIFLSTDNTSANIGSVTVGATPAITYSSTLNTNSFALSSAVANLSSTTDGSRWMYTFTPPGPCVVPTAQPNTPFNFTPVGLTQLNGSFGAAIPAPSGYLVVRTSTNVAPIPVNGTTYAPGSNAIGFVETVTGTTFTSTGLAPSTTYYYWAYSYNNTACSGGPLYLQTSPLSASATTGGCSISGTKSVGGGGANYTNLTTAIADLVANGINGPVILELNATYPGVGENFPIVLGAVPCMSSTNTVTIRIAAGAGAKTISSNSTTATFGFNGGQYWTIDGRMGGTGATKDLTITNTSVATGGSAIRFINEGSNNTVKYVNLRSSFASSTSGVVLFSTTTGVNGNDNNTIDFCDIDGGAGTTASPTTGVAQNGIYASGTTASIAQNNSGNIISNSNIFNNFVTGAVTTCAGILISSGNTDWTIDGNSIYQTSARLGTVGAATVYGISILNTSGNNFTVSNNFVGGSAAGANGTWSLTNVTTHFANRFQAIGLSVGTTTASNIQGNTIRGFNYSTNSSATANSSSPLATGNWGAIHAAAGNVNIGTVTGNTIGSQTLNGSITTTLNTNSAGSANGIGASGTGVINIANNTIGGITTTSGTLTVTNNIIGIQISSTGAAVVTVNNNTIGSATTANSLHASTAYTGTASQFIIGLNHSGSGTVNITNNLFANFRNATNTSASTGFLLRGIAIGSGIVTITGNTIRDLSLAANGTSLSSQALIGIFTGSGTAGTWSISNNTIYNLSNTHATASTYITGIYQDGPLDGGTVSNNNIYSLTANGTNANATITGIWTVFGDVPYYNNTIRLGTAAMNANINGILDSSGTSNFPRWYHNTIYIGGSSSSGASNSYALKSLQATNAHIYQNNIFINARSNGGSGTGKHYAVKMEGTTPNPTGLTLNYNIYRATGTGGMFGLYNSLDVANLAAWQTAVGQDANSKEQDPCLANPTAATPDLHLTNCSTFGSPADGTGTLIAAVTTDFEGQTRSTLSPVDIGADAGDYGPSGVDVGILAVTRPTATSCHAATENVIVTLKNFSTSILDFTVNPVTVSTSISGMITAGPLTVVLNTGTLAAGAIMPVTVGTADMVTAGNGTYTFTSTTTVTGDVTPANDGNVTNVVLNYVPLSATATADNASLCLTGSTTVRVVPAGGTAPYTFLWDAGTDLDTAANATGTISSTTTYNVIVTDACGVTANASVVVTMVSPMITGTTAGSRCGEGTVSLSATASGATAISWYAAPTGGAALGAGATFTTPTINTTTPYYVAASDGGSASFVSKLAPEPSSTGTVLSTYGQDFTVTTGFTLNSVQVYSTTGTSVTISLYSENGSSQLMTTGAVTVPINTTSTVNIGWFIAPGTYRLCTNAMTGNFIRDNSGVTYPFALGTAGTMNGFVSAITGSVTTSSSYYFTYNWAISTGCESARTAVVATVTAPPAITASATPTAVCAGQSANLNVTSTNDPDYTYTWTPGPLTGAAQTVTPSETTTYTVNATDNTTGPNATCATSATVTVTVNPNPGPVTISPSPAVACPNGGVTLTASSYTATTTVQVGTGTSASTTNTPYKGFYGGNKTQSIYTAAELEGLGLIAGSKITSLGLNATSHTGPYTFNGFTIKMKHTTASTLTTTNMEAGTSTVFGPTVLIINQTAPFTTNHVLNTPFIWDGSSNIIVEFCFNNVDGGGVSANSVTVQYTTVTGSSVYRQLDNNAVVCDTLTGTASSTRPNLVLGYQNLAPITWSPTTGLNTTTGSTVIASPVSPQVYTATATVGSCITSNTVSVTISNLAASATSTDAACFGASTGTITASGTGGTASYTYSINGTTYQASPNFTGVAAGTYTVSVKDANSPNNCVATTTVTINQPAAAVSVTATGVDPVCHNGTNGSVINATGAGGTGGYTYTITGGSFTNLPAGTYTVTATDANGCTGTVNITLNNPALPAVTTTNSSPVCAGANVVLTATNGYATYAWTGPGIINNANTDVATAIAPANGDIFTVTITDANGCTNTASTTVTVNPNLPVSVTVATAPATSVCSGTTVTFTATGVNGGTTPTYQWYVNGIAQAGETGSTYVTTSLADQDAVHVVYTSNEVCTAGNPASSTPVVITVTGAIEPTVIMSPAAPSICEGQPVTFTTVVTGEGNFPSYDFYLNGSPVQTGSTSSYTYVPVNNDQVFVILTSSYSCASPAQVISNIETVTVNPVPAAPVITAGGPTTFCTGGSVVLTSSYTGAGHLWSNGATTDAITVTTSGIYTVTYTALGCTSPVSNSIQVTVNASAVVINAVPTGAICSNASAVLTAVATPAAVSYLWSPNGETTASINATLAGTYSVTTTDANGCTATNSHVIAVNDAPTATISGNSTICTGVTETLTATATAGSGTITGYQWNLNGNPISGATNVTYSATINGSYTITVTNSNGCSLTSAAHVLGLNGPMSGTYTVSSAPASCTNYNTIALAVYDLNNRGLAGNVIIDVESGHTETAPGGGIILNNCSLAPGLESNATQTITIQRSGAGSNPVISAGTGTGTGDVIFAMAGVDYVTINAIDLSANPANTTAVTQAEWGYLLTACSGTNGAQHNTIQNCTVTLNKSNTNTNAGIAILNNAGTAITVTALSGTNSYNKFYSNTVTNSLNGIRLFGFDDVQPYTLFDQGNEIGAVGLGNTVTNFGRGSSVATSHGIYAERNNAIKVIGNNINSTGGATHIGELNGIGMGNARWANVEITDNTVTVVSTPAAASTSALRGIYCNSGNRQFFNAATAPANTILINNNIIQNCIYSTGAGEFRAISYNKFDTLGANTITITNNQILNNTSNSTGTGAFIFGGIISQPAANVYNVSGNTISNNSYTGTVAAHPRMIVLSWGWELPVHSWVESKTISHNRITNNTSTSATGAVTGITMETITFSTQKPGSAANISNNYVGNVTLAGTGIFTGIATTSQDSIDLTMTFDTVNNVIRTGTTGSFDGIVATSSPASAIISNNRLTNNTLTNNTSATFNGIQLSGSNTSTLTTAMSNNVVSGNTINGTGTTTLLDAGSGVAITMNGNDVSGNSRTGASGTMYCAKAATGEVTFNNNIINNNGFTNTSTSSSAILYGYYDASSPTVENYTNNTITNLSIAGTSTSTSGILYGIHSNSIAGAAKNISGNLIHSLTASTPATVAGINSAAGSALIAKNKIYNLSTTSASTSALVAGIQLTSGVTTNINNNMIGDLKATLSASTDAIRGINVTSTSSSSTVGIYYNTIHLTGTSSATNFGTTGIFTTTSTTATSAALDMRNNLVYNVTVPKGTGKAVAHRRSSTTLTNMTNDVNNNLYYVTGAANTYVFSNGTTNNVDLVGYKTLVAPRESNAVTENVTFQSTTGSDAAFLKVNLATPTLVEGGGQAIAGITTDYFGTTRAGVGPDIGAHEDDFQNISLNFTSISASPSATQCVATARTITAVMDQGAAPIASVTLHYAYNGTAQTPIAMSNGGSGFTYTATIPAATPGNAIVTWYIVASDGTYTPTTVTQTYQDEQLTGTSVTATATPDVVCSGSPASLSASIVKPGVAQIGTGTSTTSTYPYYRLFGSSKTQMLYRASELTAAGLAPGPITAIGFNITAASTAMPNVKILMKQTASTTIAAFESGMTQVGTEALFTPLVGISNHPITPFVWDGTSNIIVEYCFENNDAGGSSTTVQYSNPGFAATFKQYQDNAADHCGNPLGTTSPSSTIRPNVYFTGNVAGGSFTYSWSDGTNTIGTTNPITVNPVATTNYTVTATNVNGCSIVSAPIAVSIVPLSCTNITTSTATCANGGLTLTANTTGGGAPYSYAWSDGNATVYPNAQTITANLPAGNYTFTVTVTDGCGGTCTMNQSVTVNGLPTIAVSSNPVSGQVCGNPATLTATGGVSYTWAPALGLNTTSGAVVSAQPSVNTTFTVTGTDANGCTNTASQLIIVEPAINLTATGTPTTICAGGSVQLNSSLVTSFANRYSFAASTGVALADTTGSAIVVAADVDDVPMETIEGGSTAGASLPIGFTFKYEGVDYTHFSASPDGWVHLKNAVTAATSDFSNDLASTDNDPTIAAYWDDMNTGDVTAGKGYVKAVVTGTAPNRVFVLHWYVRSPRDVAAAANSNFQTLLYETSNKIEFRYGTINGTTNTASIGLASAANAGSYFSVTPATSTVSTTTVNNSIATAPASGTMYTFTPVAPSVSFVWSPSTNLDDATIANPLATNVTSSVNYVITATNTATGCYVTDTVAVTVNPLPAATFTGLNATYCSSDAASTLTGTPSNGTFSGPGVSGNVFTPGSAGPGTHTISYTVTDISTGCSNSTTQTVTVTQPTVTFTTLAASYCTSSAIVTLTGNQAPAGTFTGAGVTDNADGTATFNPATAGAGAHPITYSFTNGGGCSNSQIQTANVNSGADASIIYSGSPYCSTSGNASVSITGTTGGLYSSTTGLVINPGSGTIDIGASTAGTYTVTYTVAANGACAEFVTTTSVTITTAPSATIAYGGSPYCDALETAAVTQTGTPGGTYSGGAGLVINSTSGMVDLLSSTPGSYTVTYTIAASGGCPEYITTTGIVITAQPSATISYAGSPYCTTAGLASVTLTGTTGGTFSSTAGLVINATTGEVDLAASTPATYTVTYTVAASGGCSVYTTTASITVEVCATNITLNVKAYIEAMFNGTEMATTIFDLGMSTTAGETDSITINLWSIANLSNPEPDYSYRTVLHSNGMMSVSLPSALSGQSFYIALKHRNSIETWSSAVVGLSSVTSYDFTDNLNKAYSDGVNAPMKNVGGVMCLYSGDVNQDGGIDGSDMNFIDNDSQLGYFGEYKDSDLNGDQGTDGTDMNFVDNNSTLGLFYARPF